MRKALKALLVAAAAIFAPLLYAQTTVSGTNVQYPQGTLLATGQWCFNATCTAVTNGAFSESVTAGTQTVTVTNGGATTYLTLTNVVVGASAFNWNTVTVSTGQTYSGMGLPSQACQLGAGYTQTDSVPANKTYTCQRVGGQLAWVQSPPGYIAASGTYSADGTPSFSCTAPCLYVQADASSPANSLWNLVAPAGAVSQNWVLQVGGSTPPGGSATQLQYQVNGSTFGGVANATYNSATGLTQILQQQNLNLYGITPPASVPTVALDGAGTLTGVYEWGVAYVGAGGIVGNVVSTSIGAGPLTASSNQVLLTNIPISSDPTVTGRNIYRCLSGCAVPYDLYLVTTINDNTTTTYIDNTPDGSLGALALWQPAGFGTYSIGGVGTVMQVAHDSMTIGANAGGAPGYANTAVGTQALAANNGGIRNVAVGVFALVGNTTGQGNTGIGVHALQDVTTGLGNISLGYTSGAGITTGSSNIAIGQGSLNGLGGGPYTGSDTVAIGLNTLTYAQTPSNLTAIGFEAEFQETTGTGNTSVGDLALAGNTTGSSNTAMGQQAMAGSGTPANNTGGDNTAVGYTSMQNNSSGGANTALGMDSLIANTTGTDNLAAGWSALAANTTGTDNVGVGFQAAAGIVSGTGNVAVGYRAMLDGTANDNTAVGYEALESDVTGAQETAFGYEALLDATNTGNSAFGSSALGLLTTGANNTAVGVAAGLHITGGSTANQTSGNSVYVGDGTEAQADGDTNEDVVGYGAVGNGSNTVTLGNGSTTALFMGTTPVALSIQSAGGTPTYSTGTGVTSVVCATGYTCTNARGELTIVGGTATTGTIATVNFSATLGAAPGLCRVEQNGGTSVYSLGHGVPGTSGFTITAGITVIGATINVDYSCGS